jgi:hypothetical protein
MSIETWGEMAKSQIDPTKIEERMTEMIAEHEADPEAHLGEGESLESHRANEVIDHPAGSVPVDKFSFARIIKTWFESIDGWTDYSDGSGSATPGLGSLFLTTGGTSGSQACIKVNPGVFVGFNMSKAFYWRTTLEFSDTTNFTAVWGAGYLIDLADYNGFGFKYESGTLVAYMGDYDNLATETISGIDLTETHVYEIRYTVDPQKVEFYIDGDLVASFDSGNFPDDDDPYCGYIIKNTSAVTRNLSVSDFQYEQER